MIKHKKSGSVMAAGPLVMASQHPPKIVVPLIPNGAINKENPIVSINVGPATTHNLVVKFDGEICGGVLASGPPKGGMV